MVDNRHSYDTANVTIGQINDFVGDGVYKKELGFKVAKLYQNAQINLIELASKLSDMDKDQEADRIMQMSESLEKLYGDIE